MNVLPNPINRRQSLRRICSQLSIITLLLAFPAIASASSSPFDSGLTSLQTLFTGTVAKVASLIAIVIGGYTSTACRKRWQPEKIRNRRWKCGDQKTISTLPPPRRLRAVLPLIGDRNAVKTIGSTSSCPLSPDGNIIA